jgi:hypothetical protein
MESAGSLAAAGRDARSGRLGLGFLGPGAVQPRKPCFEGWKSLDFLGFSRPSRAFSMGYAGFSLEEFLAPFCPAAEPRERRPTILGCGKGRIGHRATLLLFLLFCNQLLPQRRLPPLPQKQLARSRGLKGALSLAKTGSSANRPGEPGRLQRRHGLKLRRPSRLRYRRPSPR